MTTASSPLQITRRILLNQPDQAFLIAAGTVDLFLADIEGADTSSRLGYIGTLYAPSVFLGVGTLEADSRTTTLVAQPGMSTSLRAISFQSGQASSAEALSSGLIAEWIDTLSQFCAPGLAPVLSQQVSAGDQIATENDPVTFISQRSVVWLDGFTNEVELYGTSRAAGLPVPLTRALWCVIPPHEEVRTYSHDEWFAGATAHGTVQDCLLQFYRAALTQCVERRRNESAQEQVRFQEKVQRDGHLFGTALRELIAPLAPLTPAVDPPLSSVTVPVAEGALRACRVVGKTMGVDISDAAEIGPDESASEAVKRIAMASSLRYRRVLLRDRWWAGDHGPMIGFSLNEASTVAMYRKSSKYIAYDTAANTRVPIDENVAATMDAHAFVLYRPFPNRKLKLLDIATFGIRNNRKDLAIILSISAVTGLLGMATPIATGVLFDQIIPEGQRGNLIQLSVILFSASIAMFLMNQGQSFTTQRLEGRMESEMEAALWDRLLNMGTGFFRKYATGDLAIRSLAINQIRQMLTGTAVSTLLSGIFSVFSLALLFSYSVELALLALGLVAIAIVFSALSTWLNIRMQRKTFAMDGRIAGRIAELLQGVSKFRVAGAESAAFARWAGDYALQKQTALVSAKISMAMSIFDSVFPPATTIAIYLVAANLMKAEGKMSVGSFLAFNAAFGQFLGSTLRVSSALLSLVGIIPIYERAKPILEELPERKQYLLDPGALQGRIEATNVNFRYQNDGPPILADVSFSIKPGEYVALVGESGSGKSTILRLLLGFETPQTGSISFDGRDVTELDMQAVRKQIGVVLQSDRLMPADIYTNIVGASTLSIDLAWEAAMRAGLDDDIRAMPMGMHTVINESGSGLSGGQRQRIMIARAIVHRPRILVFDEATSALDNQTQAIVSRSLEAMQSTRVVVAHRLSTIVEADTILVFQGGRIIESGTYAGLMAQGGYFAELAERQLT